MGSERKFTPGPWRIRYRTDIVGVRQDVGHEGVVAGCGNHESNQVDCNPESEANARLIAAAPDLLAELSRLMPALERIERDYPDRWLYVFGGSGISTLNGARAAIARATGQAKE